MSEINQTPLMPGTARQILGTRTEPPRSKAISSLRTDGRCMKEDFSYSIPLIQNLKLRAKTFRFV